MKIECTIINTSFIVNGNFDVNDFINGDRALITTIGGSKCKLKKYKDATGKYELTLGPKDSSYPRYLHYFLLETDPIMVQVINKLRKGLELIHFNA